MSLVWEEDVFKSRPAGAAACVCIPFLRLFGRSACIRMLHNHTLYSPSSSSCPRHYAASHSRSQPHPRAILTPLSLPCPRLHPLASDHVSHHLPAVFSRLGNHCRPEQYSILGPSTFMLSFWARPLRLCSTPSGTRSSVHCSGHVASPRDYSLSLRMRARSDSLTASTRTDTQRLQPHHRRRPRLDPRRSRRRCRLRPRLRPQGIQRSLGNQHSRIREGKIVDEDCDLDREGCGYFG